MNHSSSRLLLGTAVPLLLSACAAATTAVSHRQLDVQTRVSDTLFLDPAPAGEQRTLFVEVRNTSDKADLDIGPAVRAALVARGFRLVDDPEAARYLLQANVLEAGRKAKSAAERSYDGSLGSVVAGGALGGAAGYGAGSGLGGNEIALAAGGALAGAATATLADAYVRKVDYAVVTDIQISERAPAGVVVMETDQADLGQGRGGRRIQTSSRAAGWKRYRTRIVSTAERVELDWPEAAPSLVAGLTRSIAGLF